MFAYCHCASPEAVREAARAPFCPLHAATALAGGKLHVLPPDPTVHALRSTQQLHAALNGLQWRAYIASKATRWAIVEGFQPRRHARIQRECLAAWQAAVAEEARMRTVVARLRHGTAVRVLQNWQVGIHGLRLF